MVRVHVTRQAIEILSKVPTAATLRRQELEALTEGDGTAPVQVTRQAIEILSKVPPTATLRRQELEALTEGDGTAPVQVPRQAIEILSKVPSRSSLTRQELEALVQSTGTAPVQVTRQAIEILSRRPIFIGPGIDLPAGLDFFSHNWASVVELDSSYMTDITMAHTVAEERRALVQKPARTLTFRWLKQDLDVLDRFYVTLRRLTSDRLVMPLYCDQADVTADSSGTTLNCEGAYRRFFPGGRVLIMPRTASIARSSECIIRTIQHSTDTALVLTSSLGTTVTAGRYVVFPLIDVEIELVPEFVLYTDNTADFGFTVTEIPGRAALPPTQQGHPGGFPLQAGYPVFDVEPNWGGKLTTTYRREGERYQRGRAGVVQTYGDRYRQVQSFQDMVLHPREEAWKVVRFFDTRKGRVRPFWLVDQERQWKVVEVASPFISIVPVNIFADFTDVGHIGIVMKDGTTYVRKVNTIQDIGVWRLTTTGASLPAIDVNQVQRIARARLSRWDHDNLTESWSTTDVMRTSLTAIEVLNEREVEL